MKTHVDAGSDAVMGAALIADGLPREAAALMTSRRGGVSLGPFASLNLRVAELSAKQPGGVQDDAVAMAENQRRFTAALQGARPVWLQQVHGTLVRRLTAADVSQPGWPQADASITTERGIACTVLVADCLPVLLATPQGRAVGAAHAGWRGLAAGVLEATVAALCDAAACAPAQVVCWLGACIGAQRFEVGADVRQAFMTPSWTVDARLREVCHEAFEPLAAMPGKWLADLPALARARLAHAGVRQITGGHWCTFSDAERFFSYRRDGGITGRHAAAIWIR